MVNDDPLPARRGTGDFLRLRHLRLLEMVERGGSLAAAARELHLSQPAVTKMLQELETAFGTALVARAARGGTLTQQGRVALQRLKLGLAHFDSAIASARSGHAERPTLRLGLLPQASFGLLPAAMRHLVRHGPPIRLVLREATGVGLLELLAAGEVDCAIGRAEPTALAALKGARLVQVPLQEGELVIACAPTHALAKARRTGLATLQAQDWVLALPGTHTRRFFDAMFLAQGLQPPVPVVESMSFHANLQMIQAIDALTVAPAAAVKVYKRMGMAQRVHNTPALAPGPLSFMYLADHQELTPLHALGESLQAIAGGA